MQVISIAGGDVSPLAVDIIWTNKAEKELLAKEESLLAFRDVAMEVMARRVIETFFNNCKLGNKSSIPEKYRLKGTHEMPHRVEFTKVVAGLLDINFKAWNIKVSGLEDFLVTKFHFVRHVGGEERGWRGWSVAVTSGLRDVRLVGQISSNLTFRAQYKMEGRGLNLLKLTGSFTPDSPARYASLQGRAV